MKLLTILLLSISLFSCSVSHKSTTPKVKKVRVKPDFYELPVNIIFILIFTKK